MNGWPIILAVLSGGLVVFHLLLYPAVVVILSRWRGARDTRGDAGGTPPRLTVVIAAYNEDKVIAHKIDNTLSLDYPADRLEIIVVADGSDDRTHEIAAARRDMGVRALHEPCRRGKSAALNRGVEAATGEIVVFSDANNDYNDCALRALARHFADPDVGGVCGRKAIRTLEDRESTVGDGLYWRYESTIKVAESALGIMTNADGEIFAVRRELYEPIPPEAINDDAEITFGLVRRGYRIVYDPAAVSIEAASIKLEDDFRVKVRMIAGGFQTVRLHWRELLPPRTAFALAFLSHKLLRWLMPLLLGIFLAASAAMWREPLGAALLSAQVAFYGAALLGWVSRSRHRLPAWQYLPLYFSLMNVAALVGLRRFLAGQGVTSLWQKAAR